VKTRSIAFLMLSGMVIYAQTGQPQEAPKRTVYDSKPQTTAKPVPENGRGGASYRALDALGASNEDMNVIRDGNVRRLTQDGCAPEVSARIADVRNKLQALGVETRAGREDSKTDTTTQALASNWFKAAGDSKASASKDKTGELLDSVLPQAAGKDTGETKGRDAGTPENIAGLKAELEHLYAACPAGKR
jgi:hypothetical protein